MLIAQVLPASASSTTGLEEYRIGTNIEGINDYSGDWPFINRMKSSRKWMTFDITEVDKSWDTKIEIPLDKNGYPLQIPYDPDGDGPIAAQAVRAILYNRFDTYPKGVYKVEFEGKGKIHFRSDATCPHLPNQQCVFEGRGIQHYFHVKKPSKGGITMKILESDPDDRVRNIKVMLPGFEIEDAAQLFHPQFVERLKGFRILRFMVWQVTNNSPARNWSDRVTPEYISFAHRDRGVPIEYMTALANRVGADAWFSMPAEATDDYVRQSARLIHETLDPDSRIYIEYSNEVWNGVFTQEKHVTAEGRKLAKTIGLNVDTSEANAFYNARRSSEIFQIFSEELPQNRKLTRVVSGQGMNPRVLRKVLLGLSDPRINRTGQKADAIAVAYYFGGQAIERILTQGKKVARRAVRLEDVKKISVAKILDEARVDLVNIRRPKIIEHKQLADRYELQLITYEGGQAMTINFGFPPEVVQAMTAKIADANRHPRMYELYMEMFEIWRESGGTDFVNFSYISQPTRWGAWGILEYQSQPVESAHKYRAVRDAISNANR